FRARRAQATGLASAPGPEHRPGFDVRRVALSLLAKSSPGESLGSVRMALRSGSGPGGSRARAGPGGSVGRSPRQRVKHDVLRSGGLDGCLQRLDIAMADVARREDVDTGRDLAGLDRGIARRRASVDGEVARRDPDRAAPGAGQGATLLVAVAVT